MASKSWILILFAISLLKPIHAFNAPADVPTWCGKPYKSSNNALNPGGQFQFAPSQNVPLLYLKIQPRYSIFLESDKVGSFIVDASISNAFGQKYENTTYDKSGNPSGPFVTLKYEIHNTESGAVLASNSDAVNSTGNIIDFPLSSFAPRLQPYAISISGTSPDGLQTYSASTSLYVLPSRLYGSAVRIDNLFGGLYVQNAKNDWKGWYGIFPNGGYADGGHVTPSKTSFANLDNYASQGFNTISIVPDGGLPDQSYPIDELNQYWDRMDELNLFNSYELRFAFQNTTRLHDQVDLWKNRTTLLMWYTADEPDGWSYALNSTKIAYDQLRELDPYHPVSLVLNCQNFYYEEYSSGADIILEDAYPVGINATWSIPWNTPCNLTYGDCGCDNCVGELTDVSTRLDDIQTYQNNLQGERIKPTWAVIQTFGKQDYWPRIPSAAEVENMMMLSINHNAKGLTYWLYPSTTEVNVGSGEFGKVFQSKTGIHFLFGTHAIKGLPVSGESLVDASAWIVDGKMMVGIASKEHSDSSSSVTIMLPSSVASIDEVLYGSSGWSVSGRMLTKTGLKALEVGVLVLNLDHTRFYTQRSL
ncbi:uncharacterized protein RCO7_07307 [Rhynchosporium graminicola]|uniref:Glycoside hydrolase subgroup catalytic core n=1 Tax=Rhynchosporium graminicola TaxID=2792576 RepID=A0A1E1LAD9_9HELO|nr:uncharacterized protein RCO7_07307 [Rhynchosporium commune]